MIIIKIIIGIFVFCFAYHFLTKKYINPYRLVFYFGKKGNGKSTLLTKLATKDLLKGYEVYSTEKVQVKAYPKGSNEAVILETKDIVANQIYAYKFEPKSKIYIDEVNLIKGFDNRDFKNMDKRVLEWFRLQRHFQVSVYLFSQTFDVDRKIRSLCDDMFIVQKFLRVFVIARHVVRKPVIVHPQGDAPASIQDDIVEDGLLLAPFGGMQFAFIPYWAKRFDSFKHIHDRYESSPDSLDFPLLADSARCESEDTTIFHVADDERLPFWKKIFSKK